MIDLSIVVPAYNEEARLPATLARIAEYLAAQSYSYELIVVDDGSRDDTKGVVETFAAAHPWARYETYPDGRNRGKGAAVRHGILAASGREVLFSDADLSTPIEELEELFKPIRAGESDISFASRGLPDSKLAIHQPWYREFMGRSFNFVVRKVIGTDISDTQCGFKAFRGEVAHRIFAATCIDGFGFDTEIVFIARKWKLRIAEIPVTWRHQDDSRVSPLVAPFQMLRELSLVRLNDLKGRYKEKAS